MNFLDGSDGNVLGSFLNNASVANLSNAFTTSGLLNPTSFVDAAVNMNSINSLNAVDSTTSGLGVLAAGLGGTANLASAAAPGAAAAAGWGRRVWLGRCRFRRPGVQPERRSRRWRRRLRSAWAPTTASARPPRW